MPSFPDSDPTDSLIGFEVLCLEIVIMYMYHAGHKVTHHNGATRAGMGIVICDHTACRPRHHTDLGDSSAVEPSPSAPLLGDGCRVPSRSHHGDRACLCDTEPDRGRTLKTVEGPDPAMTGSSTV